MLHLPVSLPVPPHPPRGLPRPQPHSEHRLREGRNGRTAERYRVTHGTPCVAGKGSLRPSCSRHRRRAPSSRVNSRGAFASSADAASDEACVAGLIPPPRPCPGKPHKWILRLAFPDWLEPAVPSCLIRTHIFAEDGLRNRRVKCDDSSVPAKPDVLNQSLRLVEVDDSNCAAEITPNVFRKCFAANNPDRFPIPMKPDR